MHGIIKPQLSHDGADRADWLGDALGWARRNKWFLIIVMVPTLLAAAYYYIVAADQYQSEAHFVVRTGDNSPTPTSGLSQFLGIGGGVSQSRSDAMSASSTSRSRTLWAMRSAPASSRSFASSR